MFLAALCCPIARAQINYTNSIAGLTLIYSNAFDGAAANISNTPPDYAHTLFGGSNNAVWIDAGGVGDTNAFYANGNVGTAQGDSILLPFQPQSGHIYSLTASVTFSGNPGNWVGAGFAQNYAIPGVSNARFADSGVNGYDFAILTESSGNVQYFAGPHATGQFISKNGFFPPGSGTHAIKLILDTTTSQWVIAGFVDGIQAATNATPYAGSPTIQAIGITQNGLIAGAQAYVHWNSFALSVAQLAISQQPVSAAVGAGAAFTNTVAVEGTPPFSYQWYANGAAISGATNASLILNPVNDGDASPDYDVVVANNFGSITSAVASLSVYENPVLTGVSPISYTNPISLFGGTNANGTNYAGSTPTFSVSATGGVPLLYQWYTNGVAMGGATSPSLTFTNCQLSSPTNFACIVSNSFGEATNSWFVTCVPAPVAPYPQAVLAAQPIAYWRLNEQPDNGKGNIGIICNDYQGGNNGIYTNVNLALAGYSPATDPSETSVKFGETGYSYAGQIQNVDFATSSGNAEFTIEAWVNGNATGQMTGAPVVAEGIYGLNDEFALSFDTSSQHHYQFYVRNANGTVYTADSTFVPDGNWHHLVGVCDEANGQVSLYIDGSLAASTAIPVYSGVYEANMPLSIGAGIESVAAGYNLQFYGSIDDVAAFDYAASPAQVAAQYSAAGGTIQPYFVELPPTNITVAANETLTIPALAAGTPLLGGTWYDPNGNILETISTNGFLLNMPLTVAGVPSSWNGGQLELSVTNASGSTNVFVTVNAVSTYTSTINPGSVLVTNFQGWGTSLQWWANMVGGYANRTNYINLLFDTLKLNVVRYEIGGGQNPSVNNPNTPYKANMQGFESTNGVWSWNADLNQRWVLQQAEANGASLVEAFAVSAPWWMCVSSNVDGNVAGTNNLQADCETNFAIYLATVVSNLTVLDGDHFNYLIPMNEPSLGTVGQITNGYETCHVSNDQQQRVVNDLRAQLNADAPSVGVDAPGDYDEYEAYVDLTAYSTTTLGSLALFSTHSYIQNDAASLAGEAASQKRPLWVAEYGDSDSTGLTMAQHIHDDITGMKEQAWVYWMAVNSDAGNAFLYNGLAAPGSGYSTSYIIYEKYYAMGQFSEFVRPGCEILSVNDSYTLAAYNPTNSSLVLVMVNTNTSSFGVTYNLSKFSSIPWQNVAAYQTSAASNMVALPATTITGGQFTSLIPAKSVTTFVLTINPGLAITRTNSKGMTLNWNYGILQTATNVAGPYSDLTNVRPPVVIPLTNSQQFFRIREN